MALTVMVVFFLILMFVGCPIAFSMGLSSLLYILVTGSFSPTILVQRMADAPQSLPLLAIPFFILAGQLMNTGGVTNRLFDFAKSLISHIKGGLAYVNVLASMLFAGMSGSAVADAGGLGAVEIKVMVEEGYDKDFSAAVTAASSTIGPIIPPSIMMVVYGAMAEVSVGRLFVGGFIPGIMMGLFLMAYIHHIARKRNFPVHRRAPFRNVLKTFLSAFPSLLTPAILLGGILFGVATPTEVGAIAAGYALLLGIAYREIRLKNVIQTLKDAVALTASITFVLAASNIFGWIIIVENIPDMATNFLLHAIRHPILVLFIINVVLLILGCLINPTAIQIMMTPLLVAIASGMGLDLVHLGVIMVFNLSIGLITPPVGWCLYIVSELAKVPISQVTKAILPFIFVLIACLLVITQFPGTVTFLPNLFFGK